VSDSARVSSPDQIRHGEAKGRSGTYPFTLIKGYGFIWGCRRGPSVKAWIESQGDYGPETDAALLIALEDELNKKD